MRVVFHKMHGAGNDFVVLDRRDAAGPLSPAQIGLICDRHRGIGCDQLLTIEPPHTPGSALAYRIWNTDGSRAGQCGNGARCVAAWARREGLVDGDMLAMDSPAGTVRARFLDDDIELELGVPDFRASAVPFLAAGAAAVVHHGGREWPFTVLSMGNPHAVIEVEDAAAAPVASLGAALQADPRFPDSCNVGFAEVVDERHLRLRVFERGVGETLACGSGACAAVAALVRRGRLGRDVRVDLPGGRLIIDWPGEGQPVRMRGPATFVFQGVIEL